MGLFEQFPFTNFHEMNLDWVINEIKNLGNEVDNFSSELQNYVYEYLDKWIHDNKIDVAGMTNGEVNINAFTPHGDGVTDDKDAFNSAIDFCNTYGLNLALNPTNYYISAPLNNMQNSIDGRGATIIPGIAGVEETYIFNFNAETADITVSAENFTAKTVTDARLFGKVTHVVSDVDIGERGTSGYHKYAEQTIIIDKMGNIINGKLGFTPTLECVCKATREPTSNRYIKNINYKINENSDYLLGLAHVTRDFFTIENIQIDGKIISENFVGSVISLDKCTNCLVYNINGFGVVTPGTGYLLEITGGSNNKIESCTFGNHTSSVWGNIGCNYLTNTEFNNVITNRIDCHYMSFGYFNIISCSTREITLPEGGYGTILVKNCNLIGNAYAYISKRYEMPILFAGNIIIDSCNNSDVGHCLIDYKVKNADIITANLVTGDTNIYIKNCNFSNGLKDYCYITDYDKQTINVYFNNCDIKMTANVPIVYILSDGTKPIYCYFNDCNITGSNCQYLGNSTRGNYIFDKCNISCLLNTVNADTTAIIGNCRYAENKYVNLTIKNLIFHNNIVTTDSSTRHINGTQSKFTGNLATDSQYTSAWND